MSAFTWIITGITLKRFEIIGVSCEIFEGREPGESHERIGKVRLNRELAGRLKSWR